MHGTYHKIQTLFLRDPNTNYKTLLEGQYAKSEFKTLRNADWIIREKIDGMNIRVSLTPEMFPFPKVTEVTVCGKTDAAQLKQDLVEWIQSRVTPNMWLTVFADNPWPTDITLYGEGYGAGIQKGADYGPEKQFILFDVKLGDLWLEQEAVENIAEKFGIPCAPILGIGTLDMVVEYVRNGFVSKSSKNPLLLAEGVVAVPVGGMLNRFGERIITKLKAKDFVNGQDCTN